MKLQGRVRASSCGAMMLSHAVRQALVEPGMAKISVRSAAGHGPGLQRRGADLFEGQHAEHFAKAFDLTVKQRAAALPGADRRR